MSGGGSTDPADGPRAPVRLEVAAAALALAAIGAINFAAMAAPADLG